MESEAMERLSGHNYFVWRLSSHSHVNWAYNWSALSQWKHIAASNKCIA